MNELEQRSCCCEVCAVPPNWLEFKGLELAKIQNSEILPIPVPLKNILFSSNRSLILELILQIKIGMDLTRFDLFRYRLFFIKSEPNSTINIANKDRNGFNTLWTTYIYF